jgi:hypothetical protein
MHFPVPVLERVRSQFILELLPLAQELVLGLRHRTQKSIRIRGQIQTKSLLLLSCASFFSFYLSRNHQNLSLGIHLKAIYLLTAAFSDPFI